MPHSLVESKVIENWLDDLKRRIDNVNALAIVATFLAAVQAQLISFTYQNNDTPLGKAANIFSFIGLSFDILGTATGLISAMTLQPDNARIQEAALQAEQSLSAWKELAGELQSINVEDRAFQGRSMTKEMFSEIQQKQQARRRRKTILDSQMKAWEAEEEKRSKQLDELRVNVVVGNVKGFAPLMMMTLGILCFFVGMLCFVISSQPRSVWISTLVGVVISAMVLPMDAYLHRWSPKKSTVHFLIRLLQTRRQLRGTKDGESDTEPEDKPSEPRVDPEKTEIGSHTASKV